MNHYEDNKPTCIVNVLGTPYAVYDGVMPENDPYLEKCDGYFDKTVKRIVVIGKIPENELEDWNEYRKVCLRHEIVHAFMHESGIDANCKFDVPGESHPEHMVSWIAIQFPKMLKAFKEVGAM